MISLPKVFPVTCHTANVGPGTTFVVIKGQTQDGIEYVKEAVEKGATRIVLQNGMCLSEAIMQCINKAGATVEYVKNTRVALATLSAAAAGYPAKKLKLLGVTGTKGKTTTSHMVYNLLHAAGHSVALLGTVGNRIGTTELPAVLTTPQPDYLHQFFSVCVQENIEYVVVEVAAQALTFSRVETLLFDGLIFTNLDREHGELYGTMQEYFAAKSQLFEYRKKNALVFVNADDEYGKKLLESNPEFIPYTAAQSDGYDAPAFPGTFNRYNLAAAIMLCKALGLSQEVLKKSSLTLPRVPGRLEECALFNGARAFIDYAHTPGSFKSLFQTVRPWTNHLIVLFGAGGGKDHTKRPAMGALAAQYADVVIITTDNPRHEEPQAIIDEIFSGISENNKNKVICELDREKAIIKAYALSTSHSVILLLGKGPDEYQIVGDTKVPFSEREILIAQR